MEKYQLRSIIHNALETLRSAELAVDEWIDEEAKAEEERLKKLRRKVKTNGHTESI